MLKKIPKHTTKSNFIVELNEKIDYYENNNKMWFSRLLSFNVIPKFASICLIVGISFIAYKVASTNVADYVDTNYENTDMVASNDDSINVSTDSLKVHPTLLISNDK